MEYIGLVKQKNKLREISKFSLKTFAALILLSVFINITTLTHVNAAISNVINYQTRITNSATGLTPTAGNPACVQAGADTCDFRIRIWNLSSGGVATSGNNLLYQELFTNVEIGDYQGRLDLKINSVCNATINGTHSWGTTVASATVCTLLDDNGDSDSTTGVNFSRSDLYLELTFDPSGTWTSLASVPGGVETFTRTSLRSVPSAFAAQTLGGIAATGFVQLSPSSVQNTSSSNPAIWVRQQGSGNVIQLQKSGTDYFVLNNADQLALSQTGSTGGLLIGGDANLYRSAADTLKTDGGITINTNFTADGLSDFKADLRGLLTNGDGTTTTSGSGTSKSLVVNSTVSFDVGNLILINGTTYARIDAVIGSTVLVVTPAVTWTPGQAVLEKVPSQFGDPGSFGATYPSQIMDTFFLNKSLRVGIDTTGTTYSSSGISSTTGLAFNTTGTMQLNSTSTIALNTTSGLVINKTADQNDTYWTTGTAGGTPRTYNRAVTANGKIYTWGGSSVSGALNTMDIYTIDSGTWSTGASGGTARLAHVSVYYNGKIYSWGGCNNGGCSTVYNTMDIYDIAGNSWSTGLAGGTARFAFAGAAYNGKIYFWGGRDSTLTNYLTTVDIYDITNNTWSTGTAGGTARAYQTGVLYNAKIYFWAGTNNLGTAINTMDIYDIAGNSWSTGLAGGTTRVQSAGVEYNGKLYYWGGTPSSGGLDTVDIYDVASNTWGTGMQGGTKRYAHASILYNGRMYSVGGSDVNTTFNSIDIYNVSLEPWSQGAAGGTATAYSASAQYGSKIYKIGGQNSLSSPVANLDIYDTITNTWSTGANLSAARTQGTAGAYNGNIYFWGGANAGTFNNLYIYNIAANSWSNGATGGTARSGAMSVIFDGKMYIWGGFNSGGTAQTIMDIYDIATNTWSTGTSGGTARGVGVVSLYNRRIYFWGGYTGGVYSNLLDIYDIDTNSWSTGTAGGVGVTTPSGGIYEGKLYVYGGYTGSVYSNSLYIYDIATNTWLQGKSGITQRISAISAVMNGKLYILHGGTPGNVNTVMIYDMGTHNSVLSVNVGSEQRLKLDTNNVLTISGKPLGLTYITNESAQFTSIAWSTGTSVGAGRFGANVATFNNKIYVWGGYSNVALSTTSNAMDIYDIKTNSWSTGTSGGTGREAAVAVVYNSKIYYLTGCTSSVCAAQTTAVDIYDINTDSWSTGTSGGVARGAGAGVLYNEKVYVWGGYNGTSNLNSMDIYDLTTNTWSTGTAGGTARRNTTAVIYKGKLYIYAGLAAAVSNALDIYDFANNTWAAGTAGGTAKSLPAVGVYNGKIFATHGFTTVGVNTTAIYDFESGVWTTGLAGGTASWGDGSVIVGSKMYLIGGLNSASSALLNRVDILDLGTSKAEDVFTISNNQPKTDTTTTNTTSGEGNGTLFRFDAAGRAYTAEQGGWFSVGADYAEYMHTFDESLSAGDIVCIDTTDGKSIRKAFNTDANIIGVVSTQPGFVGNITNIDDINNSNPNYKLMSMVGQVPVKVIGDINVGDKIAASEIEGVGRRANDGDANIGIAQESHLGESITTISVLITRNNDGINNKVQINLGKNAEAGFRVNEDGKMQFKENDQWKNIADSTSVNQALLWEQKGNNLYSVGTNNVAVGLESANPNGSRLQVSKDVESRDGLNFIKIAANGSITFNQDDVGFRVNEQNNTIEFRDSITNEWKSLNGLVTARIRFEKDSMVDVANQVQVSGWGYLVGDGSSNILLKTINFPVEYKYQPVVNLGIIGRSDNIPEKVSDCNGASSLTQVSVTEVSKTSFKINANTPIEAGKYYCYTWLAN